MLRQTSPGSMAANAQSTYGGNALGERAASARIAGSYYSNSLLTKAQTGGTSSIVTTTASTSSATLTTVISGNQQTPRKPVIVVKKGDFTPPAVPTDINMVTLRSGKQFSPSRGTPKQHQRSSSVGGANSRK